ncbi:zinc uptake transcriptional repressor Zur [Blochmannia endosymbiont of Polyrhachis (Hedomyrma) turneri]|uniref:zinc uptake transcriptional repressor Zur n=1 Tax=Blochmannia endosymbiont of Polyrhachis (Hedomyrma) turneri TaxID=1505596 RepID=UPI00061A783E|nr:zinc uptake transcriptional repressor Zur [Blochmannia endosymbiont of Polyrhachis (Hedomyrma) turneri]AKC59623.1 Zinc uptake regulation protein [Blochmannia endosymbiont of Polyrhachis (Hedomyrma) turneri]
MCNQEKFFLKIQQICKQRHARLTPQRLKILHLISQQNNAAIRAYHLLHLLHKSSPQAKPSTIYRALKFLLSQGFIHKIESINSFILCHHFFKHSHTYVFFICKLCQKVTEKTTDKIEKTLKNLATKNHFQITYNIIEIHGICLNCKKQTLK